MVFKIRQGKHSAKPFRLWAWFRKKTFNWNVRFGVSCEYALPGVDQSDTNKLIGVGYLSKIHLIKTKRWWTLNQGVEPMHWTDSARFGWRYDTDKRKVELLAYCYVNRNRVIKPICFIDAGYTYRLSLVIADGAYTFICRDMFSSHFIGSAIVVSRNYKHFKYRLGVFFGGNQPAPHDMYINLYNT